MRARELRVLSTAPAHCTRVHVWLWATGGQRLTYATRTSNFPNHCANNDFISKIEQIQAKVGM